MAEFNTPTRYEPNGLIEFHNAEAKLMLLNISSTASTCDSAESVATPLLESDLDDEQIQVMPASPLYLLEKSKCRPTSSLLLLWPKYCSKNAEQNLAIVQVVYFRDRSSPIVWTLIIRTMDTKRHEEKQPDFMKNWHEKLITEELRRCRKEWKLWTTPGLKFTGRKRRRDASLADSKSWQKGVPHHKSWGCASEAQLPIQWFQTCSAPFCHLSVTWQAGHVAGVQRTSCLPFFLLIPETCLWSCACSAFLVLTSGLRPAVFSRSQRRVDD